MIVVVDICVEDVECMVIFICFIGGKVWVCIVDVGNGE